MFMNVFIKKKHRADVTIFYKDIKESNRRILGTVLFCNGILTLTDSLEEQSSALSKSIDSSTKS